MHLVGPALEALEEAIKRCLALAPKNYLCLMLAAQASWAESESHADSPKQAAAALKQEVIALLESLQYANSSASASASVEVHA